MSSLNGATWRLTCCFTRLTSHDNAVDRYSLAPRSDLERWSWLTELSGRIPIRPFHFRAFLTQLPAERRDFLALAQEVEVVQQQLNIPATDANLHRSQIGAATEDH
jgi:hypothetical protein